MSISADFAALIAERPQLSPLIDNITETPWGCRYDFDGYMPCHIVFSHGKYWDVQDRLLPPRMSFEGFSGYQSVLSLVLNMEETLTP